MSAERVYRLLLRAYPPAFRGEYGSEMMLVFRDQCRESDVRTVGFWVRILWDVLRSAPALRAEATRTVEVFMKVAAVLAVLFGAFGILGAVTDWLAASRHAGAYAFAVVLGVVASAQLLGTGVAILLQKRQAARVALVASLVCLVAARLLFPWMGIFLQLVGFGLPTGLLVALYWPRKSSTLGAASIVLMGLAIPQLGRAQTQPADHSTGSTQTTDTVKDLPLTPAQRQSIVGTYSVTLPMGGQDVLRIFEENGLLKAHSSHENRTGRLFYHGDGAFRPEGSNFVITFVFEAGRATGFTGRREDGVLKGTRTQ